MWPPVYLRAVHPVLFHGLEKEMDRKKVYVPCMTCVAFDCIVYKS